LTARFWARSRRGPTRAGRPIRADPPLPAKVDRPMERIGPRRRLLGCLVGGALWFLGAGCAAKRHEVVAPAPTPNDVLYQRARTLLAERRFVKAREALGQIGTSEAQNPDLDPLVKIATADSYFYDAG